MCVMASPLLACDLRAISAVQRPRFDDLVSRLRTAMRDRSELADGYSYSLDSAEISEPEVSEWIAMERLCCPFFSFQVEEADGAARLTMRGPEGVKALLREEFSAGGQAGQDG